MLDTIKTYIFAEWQMISQAPTSFILAIMAAGTFVWVAITWAYRSILSNKESELNLLERQISNLRHSPAVEIAFTPTHTPTYLRLQFSGNGSLPLIVDNANIWRWYALATINVFLEPGKERLEQIANWTIFVVFDRPVEFKQIVIEAGPVSIPRSEVKDGGPRHAIIVIYGDVPAAVLKISLIN